MSLRSRLLLVFLVLVSQHVNAASTQYREFYSHLSNRIPREQQSFDESDYYIVFLVTARRLDYTETKQLIRSLVKHANGGKEGDVGHSWIYLKGIKDGEVVTVEGGQSGELGIEMPKYYEGVMNYLKYGYPRPSKAQRRSPRYEPNPIKYLWEDVNDGFWQAGNGTFRPTFAAKIDLTPEQFEEVYAFINPKNYNYKPYSLVGQQCSSFIAQIATIVGFDVEHEVRVQLASTVKVGRKRLRLWEDPKYSEITFSTPDILERSLMSAVHEGRAQYALKWYKRQRNRARKHDFSTRVDAAKERLGRLGRLVVQLPDRLKRTLIYTFG